MQESSYPDEPCIWLGVEVDSGGEAVSNGRMHLTREGAREVMDVLRYFVNEGTLGKYTAESFHVGQWVRGVGKNNFGAQGRVVEMVPHEVIVIQDRSVPGTSGRHQCTWDKAPDNWEPDDPPPEGRSLYDHLHDED